MKFFLKVFLELEDSLTFTFLLKKFFKENFYFFGQKTFFFRNFLVPLVKIYFKSFNPPTPILLPRFLARHTPDPQAFWQKFQLPSPPPPPALRFFIRVHSLPTLPLSYQSWIFIHVHLCWKCDSDVCSKLF